MLKKIWTDPVWSKVIAAAITGSALMAGTYWAGWWMAIGSWLRSVWTFASASTLVPNWLLAILLLAAAAVLALIGLLAWFALFDKNADSSSPPYTEDIFFGVRWRWRLTHSGIDNLAAFCPHCDLQVHPMDVGAYRIAPQIRFYCDDCQAVLTQFDDMSWSEIKDRVIRSIQKKARTGILHTQ